MLYVLVVTMFFQLDDMPRSFTYPEPTLKACVKASIALEKLYPKVTTYCRLQA